MPHPLQQKVHSVARRARRLVLAHGAALAAAVILAALLAAGVADYLIRYQDRGVRIIVSLLFLAAAGWSVWRFFLPAWRYRLSDVEAARRIERRFPQLRDRLSSAVSFLNEPEDDPRAGSAHLRRAVVTETEGLVEPLRLHEAIEPRPAWKALLTAAVVIAAAALVVLLDPVSASLAMRRLAAPWSGESWPRWNNLAFENPPRRLAKGADFEVELIDRNNRLPDEVHIQYWFEGEEPEAIDLAPMKPLGDKMLARRENVTRPFRYRAAGGDHQDMPWIELEVVEPPQITALEIRLYPPAYTGWPVEESGMNIRALEGTTVAIQGTAAKPLQAVRVLVDAEEDLEIPLALTADRRGFYLPAPSDERTNSAASGGGNNPAASGGRQPADGAASRASSITGLTPRQGARAAGGEGEEGPARPAGPAWRIASSGGWRLVLTDETGVTGGGEVRHELQAVPDRPPTIALEGDEATAYVTPQAVVPVRGVVKDDLAVHTIHLRYLHSARSDQDHQTIEIFRGPPQVAGTLRVPSAEASNPGRALDVSPSMAEGSPDSISGLTPAARRAGGPRSAPAASQGQIQRIDYAWDLAELSGLEPGVQLVYHIAAADYKPQESQSPARRLAIISPRELEDRIGRRHSDILTRLAETLDKQRAVRSQVTELEIQLDEASALAPRDLDHLQSAELNQRQIQRMLSGGPEGVEQQIAELLEDVQNNRLDAPDVQRRMTELLAAVRDLSQDHLPAAQSELIDALKQAQAAPDDKATRHRLQQAGEHQDAVIASLEQMLGELSQWDNYRRVARDIHQLRRDQDHLSERTDQARLQTLGKEEKDLTPQERAGLKRLAQQQADLARRLEQTQGRMRQIAEELEPSDPLAAQALADALDAAMRQGLSGKMREASRNLEANRLGQAAQQQDESSIGLEELLNVLSNRREHELSRLVEKLRWAADELQSKQQQLKELRKKLEQAAGQADAAQKTRQLERLSQEQQQLAEEISRLARRLERLQAERAGESASQSAQSLSQAGQQSQQGDAPQALEQAEQAERDLEEAQQQLKRALAQAEQDLYQEQMARLEQAITGMIQRQQSVVEEAARLDGLRQQGELTRGQRASVASLAGVERTLADEAGQFADKLVKAQAFEFALRGAGREMHLTAARLDRGETDAAQPSARAALDRLERLAEALKTDPSENQPQRQSGQDSKQPQTQPPPADAITALAELKLLKLMQEELNQRTAALEEARQFQGQLTPQQKRELAELSQEQGRLAELLINLFPTAEAQPVEDPDALPIPSDGGGPDKELEKSLEQLLPRDLELQE